jgi:1,2-dihydroxy-3-keto-5-methylthiopentene dioxygenase
MALVTILDENKTLTESKAIAAYLETCGIIYERWESAHPIAADAPAEEILRAYAGEIDELKALGGYVTADVIDVGPETRGLEEMLAKFNREHWHDEDEVRFIIAGRGLFHIHPQVGPIVAIEVEAGDLIRVPRGTRHWFNLCRDRRIRAIRLFQEMAGWTPHYTESRAEEIFQPLCFGSAIFPAHAGSEL